MKVKGILLAGAAGVAAMPAAHAADMAVKAPALAPVPMSWTGWYVGVSAGAVSQQGDFSYGIDHNISPSAQKSTPATGFIGGGQVGYNFQSGNFVYGIEGDISGLTGKASIGGTIGAAGYSQQISWLSTIRGRVGVAIGDTMPYFTAGLAIAGANNKWQATLDDPGALYSDTSARLGWTVGGGIEHMLSRNWTIKFEGLWVDAGHKTVFRANSSSKQTQFTNSLVIARAGLNYKF